MKALGQTPLMRFIRSEAFAGLFLVCAAVLAFIWANSSWKEPYFALQYMQIGMNLGSLNLDLSLKHWVNDGLMAIFFLLVGLEIKREFLIGELASLQRVTLTITAAIGGMLLPNGLYALINAGGPGAAGWGIPMATDIAFALGIMVLLGSKVPIQLKLFLTALAIVDDLGAVFVIALFYTPHLNFTFLALAILIWGIAMLFGKYGVSSIKIYAILGVLLWLFVLQSGIHATIAGVLLAVAVPIRKPDPDKLSTYLSNVGSLVPPEVVVTRLRDLGDLLQHIQSPLHRLEHILQPFVTFIVLPIFAFINAGVLFVINDISNISLGVLIGLLIGKPLGILSGAWLAIRIGIATLPPKVNWGHMVGVGLLSGIGFTMSLFVSNLALDRALINQAKLGIFAASILSALFGLVWLLALNKKYSTIEEEIY